MEDDRDFLEFICLPAFERSAKGLLDDEALRSLEETLSASAKAGATIAGTGGVRKIRVALRGAGKSGGARIIYFYRASLGRNYLVLLRERAAGITVPV